ncbi:MAG TPA: hypothetical protein VIW23_19255 [Candidatus Acidoferrum sp.]
MMKALRFVLCAAFLMALSTAAVTVLSNAASEQGSSATSASAPSDAQKSFEQLKNLAGTWEGHVKTTPPMPEMDGGAIQVTLRVTSRGNALVHEMKGAGEPDDPAKYDHPVTMMYLEGDRLLLTHYCDAGNRPRMTGKMSADGKKVAFEFLDVSGSTQYGHMHEAAFTAIDANHHSEDWTFMNGDKPIHAHFDLERAK